MVDFHPISNILAESYSIGTTKANSDPKKHTADFENSNEIQANDNFGAAEANDRPIISAEEHRSINQQTSVASKEASPKPSNHKANKRKISPDECRKRTLTKAFKNDSELRLLYTNWIELITMSCSGLPCF